jgi:tRNA (adenine22-N1)-methyltransferase
VHSLIPQGCAGVADVGAGHRALCAALARPGPAHVIATELSAGPLRELRSNLAAWGVAEDVEVRCGPGLAPLRYAEVDVVVVAGLGANRVLSIAADAPAYGVRWLVLQCMQRDHLVVPWLAARGWRVHASDVSTQRKRTYTARLVEVGA